MFIVAVLSLLGAGLSGNGEIHSLVYIYTALSKPVGLPGIYEFMAMGLLDNRTIDYYDSESQKTVPKQEWMRQRLAPDYWKEGAQSHKSKQQWFMKNIGMLMNQTRQDDSDVHVLQWMHGCEGELWPNGSLMFHRGINMFGYDGNNFLYFDYEREGWVTSADEAQLMQREWENNPELKAYTKGECMERLEVFLFYGKKQLNEAPPPEVYVFAKNANVKTNLILTCFATGFYAKDIIPTIKRNRRVLTKEDGLMSSGVRPNGDDTFQSEVLVEILKSDLSTYICGVTHEASNMTVRKLWDRSQPSDSDGHEAAVNAAVIAVPLVVIGAVGILIVLWKQGRLECSRGDNNEGETLIPEPTPPEVQMFKDDSSNKEEVRLWCVATGFKPQDITMRIKRNECTLDECNNLTAANISNQVCRFHVEVLKSDEATYHGEVIHKASKKTYKSLHQCLEAIRMWTDVQDEQRERSNQAVSLPALCCFGNAKDRKARILEDATRGLKSTRSSIRAREDLLEADLPNSL